MDPKDKEFLKRLLATFRIEADEHIRTLRSNLIEFEQTQDENTSAAIIETMFREAHSLKGAARSVNLKDIVSICQPLESAFAALKRKDISLSREMCDLFHDAVNSIERYASAADVEQTTQKDQVKQRELIRLLSDISEGIAAPAKTQAPEQVAETSDVEYETGPAIPALNDAKTSPSTQIEKKSSLAETVRISTDRLAPLLLQAEEMIMVKIAATQRVVELREIEQKLGLWKKEWAELNGCRSGASGASESHRNDLFEWNEARLNGIQSRLAELTQMVEQDQRNVRRMVDEHLEATKKILMLPVASLLEVFPAFVRDLARSQGKDVDLVIRGADIEIDKRILDELKDPLLHIIRNCVDHGMRKAAERESENKPQRGTITLGFSIKDSRRVEIVISDDGVGVDVERVLSAAIKAGIVSPEAAAKLEHYDALSLIFQSGVSTSPIITDISGRGLGLAIVREKVEKLGGHISVETNISAGTTFRLLLPLTLTTFQGVIARAGESVFVFPTINTECVMRVNSDDVMTIENRETIRLNGRIISMVELASVLELPMYGAESRKAEGVNACVSSYTPIVVLASADKRIAFKVDEVIGEQEILMKSLGKQLSRVRNIAGATVFGSGKVVPVINVSDLIKSALRSGGRAKQAAVVDKPDVRTGNILVAEDSITSRMLIKNILETAGYRVVTAVDGIDALTQVRSGEYDLVVSDVDMPRMSGFELTTRIRDDKKFSELPMVLVTALESREDRERGIEVGANAYIVKSSFDQSNLLEVIKKLI